MGVISEGSISYDLRMFEDALPEVLTSLDSEGTTLWCSLRSSFAALRSTAVIACHACAHMADAIVGICLSFGVDFAVMPCCYKVLSTLS